MQELPRKRSLRTPLLMGGPDDVVLHLQILEQKLDRQIVVCLDSAYFRGRQDHHRRLLLAKKAANRAFVAQVQMGTVAEEQIGESILLELANERAADEAPMTRDEDFIGFFHGPRKSLV